MGLLGGSFNPAHEGHRRIAAGCLRRLRLDQVWLLVSPGNPLKTVDEMAPFAARLSSAQGIADGRRIIATDIERKMGTRFTVDTIRNLQRRFPRMRFVWLTGSDGFAQLPRWRRWQDIVQAVPIAVHPRAGRNRAALGGQAAHRLRRVRRRAPGLLAAGPAPAWLFLAMPEHLASSTALRAAGHGVWSTPRPPEKPQGSARSPASRPPT